MMCKVECIIKQKNSSSNTVDQKTDLIFWHSVVLSEMWVKWMGCYVSYTDN